MITHNLTVQDNEGILISGVAVGPDFRRVAGYRRRHSKTVLSDLLDLGRGYFTLLTRKDATRVFTERLVGLIDVAAKDVLLRLDYPPALTHTSPMDYPKGGDPDNVLPTNFSYNTTQYFFESFQAPDTLDISNEAFTLTATYTDPATGEERSEVIQKTVGELIGKDEDNLRAAEAIHLLMQLIESGMTPTEVQAILGTYPPDYSTALFDKYKELIERYDEL